MHKFNLIEKQEILNDYVRLIDFLAEERDAKYDIYRLECDIAQDIFNSRDFSKSRKKAKQDREQAQKEYEKASDDVERAKRIFEKLFHSL